MKIEAWKCQTTGKLFEFENEFVSHKRKIDRAALAQLKKRRIAQERDQCWIDLQHQEIDISQLVENLIGRQEIYWPDSQKTLINLKIDVTYSTSVSNTHSCPKTGVQNWHCNNDKPKGYPGWSGRIFWEESVGNLSKGSDRFHNNSYIYTGTGSGGTNPITGNKTYQYDVKIFADDWPGLALYREKRSMWEKLGYE
jgi:hypothetical protein